MKNLIKSTRNAVSRKVSAAKNALCSRRAEGFVDTALKILMAVVIGALILAGLYALFGDTILPTLTRRITELFNYALFFGSENLRMDGADYREFADCFVRYEERTRTVIDADGNESEETYTVAIPTTDLGTVYRNLESALGRTVTSDDQANAQRVYILALYGSAAGAGGGSGLPPGVEMGEGTFADLMAEATKYVGFCSITWTPLAIPPCCWPPRGSCTGLGMCSGRISTGPRAAAHSRLTASAAASSGRNRSRRAMPAMITNSNSKSIIDGRYDDVRIYLFHRRAETAGQRRGFGELSGTAGRKTD